MGTVNEEEEKSETTGQAHLRCVNGFEMDDPDEVRGDPVIDQIMSTHLFAFKDEFNTHMLEFDAEVDEHVEDIKDPKRHEKNAKKK